MIRALPTTLLLQNRNATVKRMASDAALKADTTDQEDFVLPYANDLRNAVDIDAIRGFGLKLAGSFRRRRPLLGADQQHL